MCAGKAWDVFLKKLPQAERDGDHIYALIRGRRRIRGTSQLADGAEPQGAGGILKAAYTEAKIDRARSLI